jgi:hypothetical protein
MHLHTLSSVPQSVGRKNIFPLAQKICRVSGLEVTFESSNFISSGARPELTTETASSCMENDKLKNGYNKSPEKDQRGCLFCPFRNSFFPHDKMRFAPKLISPDWADLSKKTVFDISSGLYRMRQV